jgi:hypothetical protein
MDVTGKMCIVFDEIMLHPTTHLVHVWKYMAKEQPSLQYLVTGDPIQLEAIGDATKADEKVKILTSSEMFPYLLELYENKRLQSNQGKVQLEMLEEDILKGNIRVKELVAKYFPNCQLLPDLESCKSLGITRAVSYFNSSASTVDKFMQGYAKHSKEKLGRVKTLPNGVTYYFHDRLVCKEQLNLSTGRLLVNCVYEIVKQSNDRFELEDVLTGDRHEVTYQQVMDCFSLGHCNTVHSTQGACIPEKFVIVDWQSSCVSLKWLYSAITRCERLGDVYFLQQDLRNMNMKTVASDMLRGYKQQDVRKGLRCLDSMYPSIDDLINAYRICHGLCRNCGCYMTWEKHSKNKVTVNRLDNAKGHVHGNWELLCKNCNCSLH